MFDRPSFIASVSDYEGKALEELLAIQTPTRGDVPISAAVLDASYLMTEPPLVRRLQELAIPFGIAPQSNRFANPTFRSVGSVAALPYAPIAPLTHAPSKQDLTRLVHRSLAFQSAHKVTFYITPALPFDRPLGADVEMYRHIHTIAATLNGSEFAEKPLLAMAAPSQKVVRSPYSLFSQLSGLPIAGIYAQPSELNPRYDSVEKLVAYVHFLRCASEYGWFAIASRVSAFGLILCALGIAGFESGLAHRESFSLRALLRPRKKNKDGKSSGGRARRVYLAPLLTTVSEPEAKLVLENPTLRSQFVCDRGSCKFMYEAQILRHKEHFYHSRELEMSLLNAAPTKEMRLEFVQRRLLAAVETGHLVNGVLVAKGEAPIRLEHLSRWQAVASRVTGQRGWRRAS